MTIRGDATIKDEGGRRPIDSNACMEVFVRMDGTNTDPSGNMLRVGRILVW